MVENTSPSHLDAETLTALGLDRQPFGDEAIAYIDEELDTKLNIAGGLVQSTGNFVLVTGRQGVGKSRFLRELPRVAPELDIRLADGTARGAGALLKCVGWNSGDSVEDLARTLAAAEQRIALAVDDAHMLPADAVTNLARAQRGLTTHDVELPIVLACPAEEAATLRARISEGGIPEEAIHEVRLGPLSEAQTTAYLRGALARAGDIDGDLLSARAIKRVYRESDGVPARINDAAVRALAPRTPVTNPAGAALMDLSRHPTVLASAGAAIAIAIAVWLFWPGGSGNPERETRELALAPAQQSVDGNAATVSPSVSQDGAPSDTGPDMTGIEADSAATPEVGNATNQPAAGVADTSPSRPAEANPGGTQKEPAATAAGSASAAASSPETTGVPAEAQEPGAAVNTTGDVTSSTASRSSDETGGTPSHAASAPDAATTQPPAAPVTEPAYEQPAEAPSPKPASERRSPANDWLSSRDGSHYTVQVLAARERATVERFLKRTEHDPRLHVITVTRKDAPWRVVVLGDFATVAEAREAVKDLPASWGAKGAWPRSFGSLKK